MKTGLRAIRNREWRVITNLNYKPKKMKRMKQKIMKFLEILTWIIPVVKKLISLLKESQGNKENGEES